MKTKPITSVAGKMILTLAILLSFSLSASIRAQSGGTGSSGQWGGVTDIFDFQVGARGMAMGGAYVSVADDPFALYWNPSSLEQVPAFSIGVYHTNLPFGTQYDYLALAYPTLYYGTFSAGLLRIGTSDIKITDSDASLLGTEDYHRTLYMFGYGKKVSSWLSIGASMKIETINIPGYMDTASGTGGTNSESAVGADFGFLFLSPMKNAILRNWNFGLNYQNAIQRTMQLVDIKENSPRTLRFGFSRPFWFSQDRNHLLVAYELDVHEKNTVPHYMHLGAELGIRNILMLRLGWNKRGEASDGYGMTYGFGLSQFGFKLDYSYWNGVDAFFGSSHRISITAQIGRTRSQKLQDVQAEELRRIQEEAQRKYEEDRRKILYSGMAEAREYFQGGDYVRAYSSINKVLSLDDSGEDPDFDEVRTLSEEINTALEAQRRKDVEAQINKSREELEARQQQRLIQEHYDKAMAFFESEQLREAIEECDRALEYDPNNEMVKQLRTMADEDLRRRIYDLIESANRLERGGRAFDALQFYNQALPLARGNQEVETFITGKIRQLDQRLEYENLLRRAVDYENNGQWKEAADVYTQAMKSQPNNQELQRRYREANARANAKQMEMTPEVKALYTQGYRALRDKNYDEAIKYYEQALEIQPLNKTILRALDHARNQKRRSGTNATTAAVN